MTDRPKIDCLVVDDEAALSEATVEYFTMLGTSAAWVKDAAGALAFLANHDVGLVLLDINLEGESGFSLCRRLRRDSDVPILFISARGGGDDDILLGLGVGGDDYIAKPYSLAVLHAKVQAVLRRIGRAGGPGHARGPVYFSGLNGGGPNSGSPARAASPEIRADEFSFGRITVRFSLERAFGPTGALALTQVEYGLLARLAAQPGQAVPKRELFKAVWGHTAVAD
ncbi:MAG: response regulator transcription factor, partial [Bifidobacteriaceae bacterium]|nr:response regulator transcription factor [Bifidobacteriaceae bacterium]